jgi:uncharacterized membrane protein YfcA
MTLVPILATLFAAQDLSPAHTVHLALGTGMASIMFTSSASVLEHLRYNAVDWKIVTRMVPGMLVGTLLATLASGLISQRTLAMAFAVIVYGGATQLLLGRKPAPSRTLPGTVTLTLVSTAIGIVCGLVSAGGAFLTVPFMLLCGVSIHSAIGTAAAVGIPVAIVGTIGYVVSGIRTGGLPDHSLGFVFLPALLALVLGSIATARFGARAAHRLPAHILRRVYSGLLYLLATKMLVTYW